MEMVLRALAEPRRQEILQLVADRELPSGEIAAHFAVSRPAISQHLQVLKAAGLVNERRGGTRHFYQARPEALALRAPQAREREGALRAPAAVQAPCSATTSSRTPARRVRLGR